MSFGICRYSSGWGLKAFNKNCAQNPPCRLVLSQVFSNIYLRRFAKCIANIQKKLELELTSYHGYYLLGAKISACVKLKRVHREIEGLVFLNNISNEYSNLFENSCVNYKNIDDQLIKRLEPKKHKLTAPKQLPKQWMLGQKKT